MARKNIAARFFEIAEKLPNRVSIQYKNTQNAWEQMTYAEIAESVRLLSASLAKLGVKKGDKIAIWMRSYDKWIIADLAVLSLGAIVVPISEEADTSDASYIIKHSDSSILFVETAGDAERARDMRVTLKNIIYSRGSGTHDNVLSMSQLIHNSEEPVFKSPVINSDDLASIVYTSGIHDKPKGVMLSHDNILANVHGIINAIALGADDIAASFLPLCHIFGKVTGCYAPLFSGVKIAFMGSGDDDDRLIKPTILIGLPSLYDKYFDRIESLTHSDRRVKWAYATKEKVLHQEKVNALKVKLSEKILKNTISRHLGGRIKYAISLGAPLHRSVAEFFEKFGLIILEGYGLAENTSIVSINRLDGYRFGTAGISLPGTQLKLSEEGELLVHGACVSKGYFKDEKKSVQLIDIDGWMRTGDLASLDDDGFLTIIGREGDTIKTSQGREVFPAYNESVLLSSRLIDQVIIIGKDREYITALIYPNINILTAYATSMKILFKNTYDLIKHDLIHKLLENEIKRIQNNLDPYQQIKDFILLDAPFSVERGDLTVSRSLHRNNIEQFFQNEISRMYER